LAGLSLGIAAPAAAAFPAVAANGFDIQITELPGQFVAGGSAANLTVVVSKRTQGCIKVRWSMVLQVEGMSLDQVRVGRVEDNKAFDTQVTQANGGIRITDVQLDPGNLCPDSTVTALYQVAFLQGAADGRATFTPEAFTSDGQLIGRDTVTRDVVGQGGQGGQGAQQSAQPNPSAAVSASPSGGAAQPTDQASASGAPAAGGAAATISSTSTSGAQAPVQVGPVGLVVGALMVFLGVGLLIKVSKRARRNRALGGKLIEVRRPGRRRQFDDEELYAPRVYRSRQTAGAAARGASPPAEPPRPWPGEPGESRPTLTLPPMRR
jgi:hypothetical protein